MHGSGRKRLPDAAFAEKHGFHRGIIGEDSDEDITPAGIGNLFRHVRPLRRQNFRFGARAVIDS